jgi:tetratricopeptide (TPR) repeat protein
MKLYYFPLLIILTTILSIKSYAIQQDSTKKMDVNAAVYYNKSIEAMKANNLKDAATFIDSSLAISHDYRIVFLKGQICFKMNNWDCAAKQFEESISIDKTSEPAYVQLAASYYNQKQYDKAIATNKALIAITSDPQKKSEAEARINDTQQTLAIDYYNQGIDLSKSSKFDEAIAMFNKSLELKKDPKVYLTKGITLSKMQKPDEAIAEIKSAIAIDSTYDMAYYTLGSLYFVAKDYKNALPNYKKALDISKTDAIKTNVKESLKATYFQLGTTAYSDKKWDAAIENFNKSNEQVAYDQAYLWLGKTYIEKKKYDLALRSLDSALAVKKTVTEGAIGYYKGGLYKQKGDYDKAIEFFKQGLTDDKYKKACQSEIANTTALKKQKK